jgi:hypothetical protein
MDDQRLHKEDWVVRGVAIHVARRMVEAEHYAHGAANTATYLHGIYRSGEEQSDLNCQGIAWWIPPTKSAALATYPDDWNGVLCLSRMVILPGVPKNACSFLLAASRKLIDRDRWPCLVTYADPMRGHTGAIYLADNWQRVGMSKPEDVFVLDGKMVSRKAGPKTRTRAQMKDLGAECLGRSAKHKFIHIATRIRQHQPDRAAQMLLFD